MDLESAELSGRLEKLEKSNHRMKGAGLAVLLVAGAGFLMGQAGKPQGRVEASEFVLLDSHGRRRAAIGIIDASTFSLMRREISVPAFVLYDEDGTVRVALTGEGYESGLGLFSKDGKQGARLTETHLTVSDGESEVSLGAAGGIPGLLITDSGGVGRVSLAAGWDTLLPGEVGTATWLEFRDKDGKSRLAFGLEQDGSPSIRLIDPGGNSRAVLGATSLITTRTGSEEKRPASSLVLFDTAGKVLWSAP